MGRSARAAAQRYGVDAFVANWGKLYAALAAGHVHLQRSSRGSTCPALTTPRDPGRRRRSRIGPGLESMIEAPEASVSPQADPDLLPWTTSRISFRRCQEMSYGRNASWSSRQPSSRLNGPQRTARSAPERHLRTRASRRLAVVLACAAVLTGLVASMPYAPATPVTSRFTAVADAYVSRAKEAPQLRWQPCVAYQLQSEARAQLPALRRHPAPRRGHLGQAAALRRDGKPERLRHPHSRRRELDRGHDHLRHGTGTRTGRCQLGSCRARRLDKRRHHRAGPRRGGARHRAHADDRSAALYASRETGDTAPQLLVETAGAAISTQTTTAPSSSTTTATTLPSSTTTTTRRPRRARRRARPGPPSPSRTVGYGTAGARSRHPRPGTGPSPPAPRWPPTRPA